MNLKSQTYMKNTEFKMRQLWLEFVDATGIALRAIAEKMQDFRAWFKKWRNKPMKNKFDNQTLELNFAQEKPKNKEITLRSYVDANGDSQKERNIIDVQALTYFGISSRWCVLSRAEDQHHCIKTKRENYPLLFKTEANI